MNIIKNRVLEFKNKMVEKEIMRRHSLEISALFFILMKVKIWILISNVRNYYKRIAECQSNMGAI